jgi:hypothetical protein
VQPEAEPELDAVPELEPAPELDAVPELDAAPELEPEEELTPELEPAVPELEPPLLELEAPPSPVEGVGFDELETQPMATGMAMASEATSARRTDMNPSKGEGDECSSGPTDRDLLGPGATEVVAVSPKSPEITRALRWSRRCNHPLA